MEVKKMAKSVRITDDDYKLLKKIKERDERIFTVILSKAIRNYARQKKVLTLEKKGLQ